MKKNWYYLSSQPNSLGNLPMYGLRFICLHLNRDFVCRGRIGIKFIQSHFNIIHCGNADINGWFIVFSSRSYFGNGYPQNQKTPLINR